MPAFFRVFIETEQLEKLRKKEEPETYLPPIFPWKRSLQGVFTGVVNPAEATPLPPKTPEYRSPFNRGKSEPSEPPLTQEVDHGVLPNIPSRFSELDHGFLHLNPNLPKFKEVDHGILPIPPNGLIRRELDHGYIWENATPSRRMELDHGFIDFGPPKSPFPHE